MADYKIEISGPGGCINNALVVVEKALREAGYKVSVTNPHPAEMTTEEHLAFVASLHDKGTVAITMKHYPWGG